MMEKYLVQTKCFFKGVLYKEGDTPLFASDVRPPKYFLHMGSEVVTKLKPKWTKVEKEKLKEALDAHNVTLATLNGYIKGKGIEDLEGRLKAISEIVAARKKQPKEKKESKE